MRISSNPAVKSHHHHRGRWQVLRARKHFCLVVRGCMFYIPSAPNGIGDEEMSVGEVGEDKRRVKGESRERNRAGLGGGGVSKQRAWR